MCGSGDGMRGNGFCTHTSPKRTNGHGVKQRHILLQKLQQIVALFFVCFCVLPTHMSGITKAEPSSSGLW